MLQSLLLSFRFAKPKPEALSRIGYHFYRKKHYRTAIYWYNIATLHEPDKNQWSFDYPAYYTWYPHLHMCVCYYNLGEYELAYEHNEQARKYRPNDDKHILHNKQLLEQKLGMKSTAVES